MSAVQESLASRLSLHATNAGDRTAFRFRSGAAGITTDMSWGELWTAGRRGAGLLTSLDLHGRHVGILCPQPQEFVISLASVMLAGAVAVPLPATLSRRSAPRVQAILRKSRVAAMIAPHATLSADWLFDDTAIAGDCARISTEALSSGNNEVALNMPSDAPFLVQFTSGSTGDPQGIVLSQGNVAANCAAMSAAYGLGEGSIGLSWLPLHHDMGLVGHVLAPMWVGGRSILMDPLRFLQQPLRWLQAISEERATITSAPNFAYDVCAVAASDGVNVGLDLRSLETAVCGGEPVIPETLDRFVDSFSRFGFRREALAPSYGLAEATLLVSSGKEERGPASIHLQIASSPGSRRVLLGRPVAGMKLRIVDPGSGGPTEDIGEVEVSGPCVGRYLDATQLEWVKTGDLGCLCGGRLVIVGRTKELLILRGENVYPADVEAAVLTAGAFVVPGGVAAFGVGRQGTEAMVVVAEVRAGATGHESWDGLQRRIRKLVAAATGHVPDELLFVKPGSLPRTTSGKLRRREIADLYRDGRLRLAEVRASIGDEAPLAHA